MKKFSVKLVCAAILVVGVTLSHAITSIPINGIKASATLPDVGQNNFRPENMVMKNYVHPFYQGLARITRDSLEGIRDELTTASPRPSRST